MQVLSAKSLLPPSRGLPALQSTWVSKTATSRFSTLFSSLSNRKLALVLHIVLLHPGGGPGQDSCTEHQLAASWKGKAKESSVTGDVLFRSWEATSTKCFQFFLFVSQNRKQTTSSVQPIMSLIELDLLFLWFPGISRLTVKVEVAFNSEGRNITCTIVSFWKCNWPFPSKQPSHQALCKAYNNFPGAPEHAYQILSLPWQTAKFLRDRFCLGAPRVGCGMGAGLQQGMQGCTEVAVPQSPNKSSRAGPLVVPRMTWQPRLPGRSSAMRQVWPAEAVHQASEARSGSRQQGTSLGTGTRNKGKVVHLCAVPWMIPTAFPHTQPWPRQVLCCASADLWHGQPNPLGRERLQQMKVSLGPWGLWWELGITGGVSQQGRAQWSFTLRLEDVIMWDIRLSSQIIPAK